MQRRFLALLLAALLFGVQSAAFGYYQVKDGNGVLQDFGASGSGTSGSPFVVQHQLLDAAGSNVATVGSDGSVKVDNSSHTQPVSATQSGTWTVQPGNTANTTAWLFNLGQVAGGTTSNAGQTGALQVGGAAATNSNISTTTYPLLFGGSDYGGTPKIQNFKVDSSGNGQFNVTQFGGSAVVTGTGAGGSGIPRVTVSNDSVVHNNTSVTVQVNPTISTSAYVSGYNVGGLLTLSSVGRVSGGSVDLNSITVFDKSKQNAPFWVTLYSTNPTNSTFTDHATQAINNADIAAPIGSFLITAGGPTFSANSFYGVYGLSHTISIPSGTTLYASVMTTGTPTYAGANDLEFTFTFIQR